jgi:uncharacterized DUF497 family protein
MRYHEIITEAVPTNQDHWEVIQIGGRQVRVGWQLAKDTINKRSHQGLSLRDGIPVIANPSNQFEVQYENGEEREKIIGFGANNVVLVVVAQWVEDLDTEDQSMPTVRIISVRRADRREIRIMRMNEDVKPKPPRIRRQKPIDPDNPPLTGKEVWGRWGDRVNAKIKAHDEKIAAAKKVNQPGKAAE